MIDQVDSEILRLLTSDGRMPYLELARRAHLSANATAERVRKLLRAGVITGFSAKVNQAALGRPLAVYVDFRVKPGADSLRFEQALKGLDGAVEFTTVSGRYDYQVKLACVDQYDLMKKLVKLRLQPGVQETYTRLILGETRI
jgi:Lrp/AsnC family transcriptional regulator, leucine-responsive regulatory protein